MSARARPQSRAAAEEQPYVDRLYDRLDQLRATLTDRLADLYRQRGGTHQATWERDAFVARDIERLERLRHVEPGLCFGRLDLTDGDARYIGRTGLSDDDYETLLVDWRAPAAEPFYRATAATPVDVVRRRHMQVRHRRVTAVDDELLDRSAADHSGLQLAGEAALLAAVDADRSGRMTDIVATIQAEQDRIIRSEVNGVLVVQGAPGTGKTVAALHRAAYLLYTHRDRLSRSGVLVIGPNRTFLRYIEQVLPSLGETGVVMTTLGETFPGVSATVHDPDDVAAAKGDTAMVDVIAAAVRALPTVPDGEVVISVDRVELVLTPAIVRTARTRARRSRRPHNQARAVFARELLTALAHQHATMIGATITDDEELAEARDDLAGEPAVRRVIDQYWPSVDPRQLVASLDVVRSSGLRDLHGPWSVADIPLLDEAAELLGEPDHTPDEAERRTHAEREAEVRYAEELLESLDLDVPVDAKAVAERYRSIAAPSTVADRAARDRTWAFGHVIVDEAQELSPMAWRMVMRRIPTKSMTIVGDIAQTAAVDGARSWGATLDAHVRGRWREEQLTVNYRTPAQVMDVAADVLAEIDPALRAPSSVRRTAAVPWCLRVDDVAGAIAPVVRQAIEEVGDGRVAVVVPTADVSRLARALIDVDGVVRGGDDPAALDRPAVLMTVRESKGLEFDTVIVVEPAQILSQSPRGRTDLYVAVTRATQRLGVVHSGDLPTVLRRLTPRPSPSARRRCAPDDVGSDQATRSEPERDRRDPARMINHTPDSPTRP